MIPNSIFLKPFFRTRPTQLPVICDNFFFQNVVASLNINYYIYLFTCLQLMLNSHRYNQIKVTKKKTVSFFKMLQ